MIEMLKPSQGERIEIIVITLVDNNTSFILLISIDFFSTSRHYALDNNRIVIVCETWKQNHIQIKLQK